MENHHELASVTGVIGLPNYTRHNRMGQYVFINRRGVTSPLISFAIKDGYGTALPTGRHSVFALYLDLPGPLVDVNVHPQKREVRLRQEQVLRDIVIKAVHKALRPQSNTFVPPQAANIPTAQRPFIPTESSIPFERPLCPSENTWVFNPKSTLVIPKTEFAPSPTSTGTLNNTNLISSLPPQPIKKYDNHLPLNVKMASPKVLATILRYIIADAQTSAALLPDMPSEKFPQGLLLIDQKAAHARVLFEKLLHQNQGQISAQQSLLVPYPIDLPSFEAALLQQALPELNTLGIHIREFGTNTFLVDSVSQIFGTNDIHTLIIDIVHALRDSTCEDSLKKEKEKHIAMAASRAAISSHTVMSVEEAQALVTELARCEHPHQCPAGKPTLRLLSPEELDKQFFKR
jgi:DNA mismatch repair protein MutL